MTVLVVGLILFLGVHSTSIVAEPWRNRMAERLGENVWKGLFTVVSLIGLLLIIFGYGDARYEPAVLYTPPAWTHPVGALLLVPVFPLLFATYFPGRIKAAVGHPMLLAVKLWAFAHLLVNGTLADVLLFGGFLAWAAAQRVSLKHRGSRPIPGAPAAPRNDLIAVIIGLLLYIVFAIWFHRILIGVAVF